MPGAKGTDSFKVCHEQSHGVAIGVMGEKKSHDQSHTRTKRHGWMGVNTGQQKIKMKQQEKLGPVL